MNYKYLPNLTDLELKFLHFIKNILSLLPVVKYPSACVYLTFIYESFETLDNMVIDMGSW